MKNIQSFFNQIEAAKVIAMEIPYAEYVALDLSINNKYLKSHNLNSASDYENFIQNYLQENKAKIAFGGYQEVRNLYKRSSVFNDDNQEERNIHIGLDLWINESATIHAALDGVIHSFQENTALGDYGPTIILQHEIEAVQFYTLYGHLSQESLLDKKVGDVVNQGDKIARLGMPPINGDYAPHLHFQIIMDIENKRGDYPGVCSEKKLDFYHKNCPDPNWLLKIN